MDKRGLLLKFIDYFMLGLLYLCKALTYVLPVRVLYGLFGVIGSAVYHARPGMKRNLKAKIRDAMPEITDAREIERIGRGACTSMVLPVLEGLLYWRHSDAIMRELQVEGMENFDKADAEGKGVVVFSIHTPLTVMQCHMVMARLGKSYTVIVWDPGRLPVPHYAGKMADLMMERPPIPAHPAIFCGHGYDAIKPMGEHVAGGGRLGLVVDVPGKCVVPLFGRPAAIADGVARLALAYGTPMVPVSMRPLGPGLAKKITIYEPIHCERTGDDRGDVIAAMEKAALAGEKMVREAPEQWMCWFGLWHWWDRAKELQEKRKESS